MNILHDPILGIMENPQDLEMIEKRLRQGEDTDMPLDEFAAQIGVDISQVRADVDAGTPQAKYEQ